MLRLDRGEFKDESGRIVVLRGVNFAADVKTPAPGTNRYVNRPCTLEDADTHFDRIKSIGFNCIRFLFTWDALQPDHPDKYDDEYMDFAISLVRKAIDKYGFYVFMDPHQDIWSRFSGGSGAPLWTLHAAGFDPDYFAETHAAMIWDPDAVRSVKMQWASNYHRLVCQTMFTLFFAGPEFAPLANINGINVGTYLKDRYFAAIARFMEKVNAADLGPRFLGWESLNEPGHGLIGYEHLNKFPKSPTHVKLGTAPTPFQAMLLGRGIEQSVETYKFTSFGLRRVDDSFKIKPKRGTWLTPDKLKELDAYYGWDRSWSGGCIWELHGVYDSQTKTLLKPNYFENAKNALSSIPSNRKPSVAGSALAEGGASTNRKPSVAGSAIAESGVANPSNRKPSVADNALSEGGTTNGHAKQPKKAEPASADSAGSSASNSQPNSQPGSQAGSNASSRVESRSQSQKPSTRGTSLTDQVSLSDVDDAIAESIMLNESAPNEYEFEEDTRDMHLFVDKYFVRHWIEFSNVVCDINPDWFQFMQAPVNTAPPHMKKLYPDVLDPSRVVYTPHFYDGLTLMLKRWRWLNVDAIGVMRNHYGNPLPALRFGDSRICQSFAEQFLFLKEEGRRRLGDDVAFLMSEIGIPYDMDKKNAYESGYWDNQIRAMDANLKALEQAKANYTLWCYTVNNTHKYGDNFAGEDLSIYSKDDEVPELKGQPENGVRAAASVIRPTPVVLAGEYTYIDFNIRRAMLTLKVVPRVDAPTEVFLPRYHFPNIRPLVTANVTQGFIEVYDQRIVWNHHNSLGVEQTLVVTGEPRFRDSLYSYFEGLHKSAQVVGRQLKFMSIRSRSGHFPRSMSDEPPFGR